MRRFLSSRASVPLLFAVLTVLGYGLLLGKTGFYWDDWGFAWAARFLGSTQFIPSFAGFRPFLGPIFFLTTSLIPPVPLYWQIFALLIRLCIGLSAWWALKSFWPERPRFALVVALFLLLFPGYSQHWVALTHINQELIPSILYLLSFGVSAHAIRRRSAPLTALALFLQFWGLFSTEYFFGLEPLRFLFIWSMIEEEPFLRRVRHTLLLWLPYGLLWLADGLWLARLYHSDAYVSYGIDTSRAFDVLGSLAALVDAVLKAGVIAWGQIVVLAGSRLPAPTSLLTFGLSAIAFLLLFFYLSRLELQVPEAPMGGLGILAGLAGILLGRLPSLAAGLPLALQSVFDRFMISMALGASLLMAGLIELIPVRHIRLRWAAISLLLALGVGQQFYNANLFRRDWTRQQEIYWQMAWRIPALQPSTLILTSVIPDMPEETDLSFTAPVNWLYAPDYRGGDLPYALLYTEARLGGGGLPSLAPHTSAILPFRTVSFRGSTDAVLTILVPQRGCLRVLDPRLGDAQTYDKEEPSLVQAIALSDPARILLNAAPMQPPSPPFGEQPIHTWCYYYEKAELMRQAGNWEAILRLEKQANALDLAPQDELEWLPFIEAEGKMGDPARAVQLSREALKRSARVRKGLCNVWQRVLTDAPERGQTAAGMLAELECAQ